MRLDALGDAAAVRPWFGDYVVHDDGVLNVDGATTSVESARPRGAPHCLVLRSGRSQQSGNNDSSLFHSSTADDGCSSGTSSATKKSKMSKSWPSHGGLDSIEKWTCTRAD